MKPRSLLKTLFFCTDCYFYVVTFCRIDGKGYLLRENSTAGRKRKFIWLSWCENHRPDDHQKSWFVFAERGVESES